MSGSTDAPQGRVADVVVVLALASVVAVLAPVSFRAILFTPVRTSITSLDFTWISLHLMHNKKDVSTA